MDCNHAIKLVPALPDDFINVYHWLYHKGFPYMGIAENNTTSPEEFKQDYPDYFFNGTKPEKSRSYIIKNEKKDAIGHISYTAFHLLPGIAELDIWLADQKFTGKGIGTEGIKMLSQKLLH